MADPITNCSIPFTDFKPLILKYISTLRQSDWHKQTHNKLHEIKPLVGPNRFALGESRRDQVVLTRCRLGHTRVTHQHLFDKEEPAPTCIPCDCPYGIKHVLIDCIDVADIRQRYYTISSIDDLFNNVAGNIIVKCLEEIHLYSKI